MNLPSLYACWSLYALSWPIVSGPKAGRAGNRTVLTYFHPTWVLHFRQKMSRTMCIPVVICRSMGSPSVTLTLEPPINRQWIRQRKAGVQNKGLERLTRCQRDRRDHVGLGMPAIIEDIVSYALHTPIYTQLCRRDWVSLGLTLEIIDSMVEKWAAHDLQP